MMTIELNQINLVFQLESDAQIESTHVWWPHDNGLFFPLTGYMSH